MLLYGLFKQPCVIYLSFPYFPLGYCLTQLEHIPLHHHPTHKLHLHPIITSLQLLLSPPFMAPLCFPFFCGYSSLYTKI